MQILDALVLSLELTVDEADYVRKLHFGHGNQLRLSHYTATPSEKLNKEVLARLPAHTDWRYVLCSAALSGLASLESDIPP